jgi:hypothetical protein
MKHWILSPRAGALGALAQSTVAASTQAILPSLQQRMAGWTARCLKQVCDATGITDAICRVRHQRHHRLYRVEFGGGYVYHCEKCSYDFYARR